MRFESWLKLIVYNEDESWLKICHQGYQYIQKNSDFIIMVVINKYAKL